MEWWNIDDLVKRRNPIKFVIPAKAGIQLFQDVLDPGACPGPDPGFAGVTLQETFYETINIGMLEKTTGILFVLPKFKDPIFHYSTIPSFHSFLGDLCGKRKK